MFTLWIYDGGNWYDECSGDYDYCLSYLERNKLDSYGWKIE